MRSDIHTISPKIIEKYNITQEQFTEIIDMYFAQTRVAIKDLNKPEIALLWGTLIPNVKVMEKEINTLRVILKNKDTDKNELSPERLEAVEDELQKLIKILAHRKELKSGKTERGKQGTTARKHKRKKENMERYKKEHNIVTSKQY